MTSPYWLTITEVCVATGLSRDSIKRALRAGKFPNARKRDDIAHTWEIPLGDLTAAGFRIRPTDASQGGPNHSPSSEDGSVAAPEVHQRMKCLELELHAARALMEERALRIADLQMALAVVSNAVGGASHDPR